MTGPADALITAKELLKRYDDHVAVNGISFSVNRGEVFGIVGPNGAGKTTTVNMITGKCIIDSGDLFVLGKDARSRDRDIRKSMGVVPQEDSLDPDLSVYENLQIYAGYFGVHSKQKIQELLGFFDLVPFRDYNVMELSGGMRRRLTLARGLINDPLLLILDEPTTGLDPQVRHNTWDKLLQIKERGITILLTTHYMEEVTRLCDRVMIMHNGTIIAIDTPRHIVASHYPTDVIEVKFSDHVDFNGILGSLSAFRFRHEFSSTFGLIIPERFEDAIAIHTKLSGLYPTLYPVRRPPNLEDAFLAVTGTSLHEGE